MHHPKSIHYPGFCIKMGACNSTRGMKNVDENHHHHDHNNRHESEDYHHLDLGYCEEEGEHKHDYNEEDESDVFIPAPLDEFARTEISEDENFYDDDAIDEYSDYEILELELSEEWKDDFPICVDDLDMQVVPHCDDDTFNHVPEVIVTECHVLETPMLEPHSHVLESPRSEARVRFSEADSHHHYHDEQPYDHHQKHYTQQDQEQQDHQGNHHHEQNDQNHLDHNHNNTYNHNGHHHNNNSHNGQNHYLDEISPSNSMESFMSGLSSATNTTCASDFCDDLTPTRIQIYMKYNAKSWVLTVGVKQAECPLNPKRKHHRVYWQVHITLLPFKKHRLKTRYKSTSTPIFNQMFDIDEIAKQALSQMAVRYRVYGRYGRAGRKKLAGQVEVELGSLIYKQDNLLSDWRILNKGRCSDTSSNCSSSRRSVDAC